MTYVRMETAHKAIAHAIWDGKVRCAMKVSELWWHVIHECI